MRAEKHLSSPSEFRIPIENYRDWRSGRLFGKSVDFKARFPVSYADAFSIALAKRNGARVMTGDPEFKSVESEIAVQWLPVVR